MTSDDWQQLKQDAQEFMDNVNLEDMPDIDYAMLGASVAILNHIVPEDDETYSPGLLDGFSDALERYDDTRSEADRDKMRKILKMQLGAIEKELVQMRSAVHDPEAVKMFVEFRENIRLKI